MRTITLSLLILLCSACGGSQGAPGTSGANGTTNAVVRGVHCAKLDSGTGTNLEYRYDSETLTNGDRAVTCSVATSSQESTYDEYYASSQPGASTGACLVYLGVGATDFGFWSFTSQSGVNQVVYSDVGSAHNGYGYTFASGDCTSF